MDRTNNNILEPSFKKFLSLLNDSQVEYLVIGGYAVAVHGYIRATGDIDIWINQNAENADKMLTVMLQFGFEAYDFQLEDFMVVDGKAGFVSIGQEPFKIEILGEVSGVQFSECFTNKIIVEIEQVPIPFINLSDLIKNKRASGRPKDLLDIDNLPELES